MSGFVVIIRREFNREVEIHSEAPTENSAITRADRLFSEMLLDTVAVAEANSKDGFINVSYKRERKCKHHNIQFTLTNTGVNPVCCQCDLTMVSSVAIAEALLDSPSVVGSLVLS